ncbi:ABC transporter ATP-binding protein [Mammaliicoccus sp. Dog046]|uniref:ABC transporter ATP-binding protein n=1 Tax=Mammaliicoccus sp. Dog046 TaxID=3034233 RepID=UPI002B25900E|nr:ABC transporter ATP-binding protein [Mammaliicoccus sp. Dog046]WQK84730.1 ABC transporter ATP-binding protein [Mammaliicoccus sp. Dog046]
MLSLKNLRLKFPEDERIIFKNINIEIKDKEKVLLLGPSGSGKSTLLNVLSGIIPRSMDIPMKYDHKHIDPSPGVIFQDPDTQFCMPRIKEELAFILENKNVPAHEMDPLIIEAMQKVNLEADASTKLDRLSGGMKQKLAIASMLLQESDTLFLDEPTAMLDREATTQLWNLMMQHWEHQTVVIVEHKVDYIWNYVDRVIVMNETGEITHDSTPEDILNNHTQILNQYGVWHPNSWQFAPQLEYKATNSQPLLSLDQLNILRGKRTLFNSDHITINSGEWITLTGKNGTGKTTFLESIMQLVKYKGEMSFEGQPLNKVKDASQHIYFVYQNPELQFIEMSVYNEIYINFAFQDKATAQERTIEMLQLLKLEHVKHQHPFELSIGQKKRLSVATALSTQSDIILLDEPTFGLDSHNTFELIKLFHNRVQSGQTILMITHENEIINRYATKQFTISHQQLLVTGGDIDAK